MPNWKRKLLLGDIWQNDDMEFEARRDAIVARLRRLIPWANRIDIADLNDGKFEDLVHCLTDVADEDEFNEFWSDVYDWADEDHRLWIDLFESPKENDG